MRSTVLGRYPDRLVMSTDLDADTNRLIALDAVDVARRIMPKSTGTAASLLEPIYGDGYFGVRWVSNYVWFQERGISAFTMRSLAGKTIPMWIDDPTGAEARKNPKAPKRVTASGKRQVLIFRRAAKLGQRKMVRRGDEMVNVPASFPGAPGRIALREARHPWTRAGKVGGQIAVRNVGVRWRHPGLIPRYFLHHSMELAAIGAGLPLRMIQATDARWGTT